MSKLLNKNQLKVIALLSMFIDHMYKFGIIPDWIIFEVFGRLAFPIFAFSVAEGAFFTMDRQQYLGRMFLFAVLSELPFDLMVFGRPSMQYQNIMWTFSLAVSAIFIGDYMKRKLGPDNTVGYFWHILFMFMFGVVSAIFMTDYHIGGVFLVVSIYLAKKYNVFVRPLKRNASLCIILANLMLVLLDGDMMQLCGILGIIPLLMYNGERGSFKPIAKSFYWLYPFHMFAIYFINMLR